MDAVSKYRVINHTGMLATVPFATCITFDLHIA